MPLAAEVAAEIPGAEAYCFNSINIIGKLRLHWASTGKPIEEAREELGVPYMLANGGMPEAFANFCRRQIQSGAGVISGHIFNSCYAFEGRFIDLIKRDGGSEYNKTFVVGPLNSFVSPTGPPRDGATDHECLRWLDEQPPASVVYVSFGTTSDLSGEVVAQLATGLEASGHRFLCVLRDVDKAFNSAAAAADHAGRHKLPPGFCERNEGVGKVVRSWAPQREILAHPSTAAFKPLRHELDDGELRCRGAHPGVADALGPADVRAAGGAQPLKRKADPRATPHVAVAATPAGGQRRN